MPVRFSRWSNPAPPRADLLGEHNEEVLRELLAISDADIAALYVDKVLVSDPLLQRGLPEIVPPNALDAGS